MRLFFTIDTELSVSAHKSGMSVKDNYDLVILGKTQDGSFGIEYQLKTFKEQGVKATFFVEALCVGAVGYDCLERMVHLILEYGQEVQLHMHTEWLKFFKDRITSRPEGLHIGNFSQDDQIELFKFGSAALLKVGAPKPIAYRAGNFGANADTIRACEATGITYDSSVNAGLVVFPDLKEKAFSSISVIEVPVTTFNDRLRGLRPTQICAVSFSEMKFVVHESIGKSNFVTIVSHSFELINRSSRRVNLMNKNRHNQLCKLIELNNEKIESSHFTDLKGTGWHPQFTSELNSNPLRTTARYLEQAVGKIRFGQ
jgi:hypothetical protein